MFFGAFTPLFFVFTLPLGCSALAAGAAITPFAAGSALSAALSGRYAVRHGPALIAAGPLLMLAGFVGSVVAVELMPHHATALATLGPILVAGTGGLVIAPNQSLAPSGVPLPQAGTAGGLLQTGQRIGASIGIAAVGAAFFSTLRGHGTFSTACRNGVAVVPAIAAAALLLAFFDWRRARHPSDHKARPRSKAPDDPNEPDRDISDRR